MFFGSGLLQQGFVATIPRDGKIDIEMGGPHVAYFCS